MSSVEQTWMRETYHSGNWDFDLLVNTKTGDVYNWNDKKTIRYKCMKGLVMSPLATLTRSIYSFAASIFLVFKTTYQGARGLEEWKATRKKSKNAFKDIFRAIWYGTGMETALIYGLFVPYKGREVYGKFERTYNRQEKADFKTKYYTARCFQPLTNKNDGNCENRIQGYLDKTTKLWEDIEAGRITRKDVCLMTYGFRSYKQIMEQKPE